MPVVDSWALFGLNADFFAMSLDCDSGTNILRIYLNFYLCNCGVIWGGTHEAMDWKLGWIDRLRFIHDSQSCVACSWTKFRYRYFYSLFRVLCNMMNAAFTFLHSSRYPLPWIFRSHCAVKSIFLFDTMLPGCTFDTERWEQQLFLNWVYNPSVTFSTLQFLYFIVFLLNVYFIHRKH